MRQLIDRRPKDPIDPVVFWTALGLILVFVILGAAWPKSVGNVANTALDWLLSNFGWILILASAFFVGFTIYLALSRYGRVPLGRDGEKPEFSTLSWVMMMFSAGMGIGLMFYGVTEPIEHLATPAPGTAAPGTQEAARQALAYSFFHWGIQPWCIYSVVAIALGYSAYRKGRGNLFSQAFIPLIGKRRADTWGKAIDVFAIVVTKFGSATSLGLGALEINAGLAVVFGIKPSNAIAIGVMVLLTAIFVLSAVSGIDHGIKWLANLHMVLAGILAFVVFTAGPTVFILNATTRSFGDYLFNFLPMSFRTAAFGGGGGWLDAWTIFYWAWWVSWALHVGTFLSRISRGRTIREFVIGAVCVPTAISIIWFGVFGGAGLRAQLTGSAHLVSQAAKDEAYPLFTLLKTYPLFTVTGLLAIVLVGLFFIASANCGAFVLSMLSSRGASHPRNAVIVVWGCMSAVVAAVLLLVGGLGAIQTFVILVASPFMLVMICLCWALLRDLRTDPMFASTAEPASVPVKVGDHGPIREQAALTPRAGEPKATLVPHAGDSPVA